MKTKKINLQWQSFILGIALCAVVVVFLGSKPYGPQMADTGKIEKAVTLNELMAKNETMEKKMEIMNQRMIILETKLNEKFTGIETKLNEKFTGIETRLNEKFINLNSKFDKSSTGSESNLGEKLMRIEAKIADLDKGIARILKNQK